MNNKLFTFQISLSVLDHLGRKLYRNFATILGEAISNSWDADAKNVWIYINKETNSFIIKDDGDGMTSDDFQNKFLKIGYSKRRNGKNKSKEGRSYIGRKGIGKLALLSCSDRITIISKIKKGEYIGGVIDNSGLDNAITEDLIPEKYPLEEYDLEIFGKYLKDHEKGTLIYFENINDEIKNSLNFLKKTIALYFRFSLLDEAFNVFINGEKVTLDDLDDLSKNTQFLWNINNFNDPYIKNNLTNLKKQEKRIVMEGNIKGFIASVKKPRYLKIIDNDEKVGVDLFVNGRIRERDILKHIPTDRIAMSYLYGQIHFDELDDEKDRFTSSRESIIASDEKFEKFLDSLRKKLSEILEDWDKWRLEKGDEGDPENDRISKKERTSLGLYNAVSKEFEISENPDDPNNKKKVEGWFGELGDDAKYNLPAYTECFISENLVRKHIKDKTISLSNVAKREVEDQRQREQDRKQEGNININLRQDNDDLSYLDMDYLSRQVDTPGNQNSICNDAKEYKPIRNALMHTALLTNEAKQKLTTIRENIKARVKNLLSGN
jgi:hypothetical protein